MGEQKQDLKGNGYRMPPGEVTNKQLRLSVLDVAPVVAGSTAQATVRNTLDLARLVEELGYTRYWLAEHHNSPSIASAAPDILIGHIASATSSIRVGAGGVMLPNHSPLHVAETFRLLEALHPGRIDLGLGRAPGTDSLAALALRRSPQALSAADFPQQLEELLGFLHDDLDPDHPFSSIVAIPAGVEPPEIWMLGSSTFGGSAAAQLGLGFAFAHHINPGLAVDVLRAYRERFQPSIDRAEPESILTVSAIVADTDERAAEIATSVELTWVLLASGRHEPLLSVEDALSYPWTPAEERQREAGRSRHIIGSPERVRDQIKQLAEAAQADEVMVLTMVHDHADRRRSYELLAEAFALSPAAR